MTSTAAALAEQVSRRLEPVYTLLDRVADEVLRCRPARAPLTEANLAALHRMLADLIAAEPLIWGRVMSPRRAWSTTSSATWPGGSATTAG